MSIGPCLGRQWDDNNTGTKCSILGGIHDTRATMIGVLNATMVQRSIDTTKNERFTRLTQHERREQTKQLENSPNDT